MIFPSFKNSCDGCVPYTNVILTNKCPHNCIYCIAKKTRKRKEAELDIVKLAEKIKSINYPIAVIEGGEPLLYPQEVNQLVDLLLPHIKYVSLFTSLPNNLNTVENKKVFKEIISKISRCTISIASSDPFIAAEIMQTKPQFWRNDFIKELVNEGFADKFRVSFLLCKNYIDTDIKVKNEIETLLDLGVNEIKIGELALQPDKFVGIKDIYPDINLGNPIYHGCQTLLNRKNAPNMLKNLNFKNKRIIIKRICALTTKNKYHYIMTLKEKFKLILRNYRNMIYDRKTFKILYNDGSIKNSWG